MIILRTVLRSESSRVESSRVESKKVIVQILDLVRGSANGSHARIINPTENTTAATTTLTTRLEIMSIALFLIK